MSTILDALRKAQEETGSGREVRIEKVPVAGGPTSPRRQGPRRLFGWLAVVLGVLAVAFAGGLALGNRVSDLFGGADDQKEDTAAAPEVAAAAPAAAVPPAAPGLPAGAASEQAVDAGAPPTRVAAAAQPPTRAAAAASARVADEPVPTPYGQLHVFGAAERPAQAKGGGSERNEDRNARLQQLRERMLKQRQEAAQRGGARSDKAPVPIIVPPPRGQAAAEPPVPEAEVASANQARRGDLASPPPRTEGIASDTGGRPVPEPAPEQVDTAPAAPEPEVVAAARAPAQAPAAEPLPRAVAVGVSIGNAHAEKAEGEIRDPDITMADDDAKPAPGERAPTAVASLPPQVAPAPAEPPVLRRSPGGAPQVSINILQWSAEPDRRFAFVSVDGGGMTQVREGDRIGGLTVKHIHQQMIEFGFNDSTFLLRAN